MYPPVFSVAFAASSVTALVGSSPCRIYPFGEAPEGVTKPYVTWQTVVGFPENYVNQVPDTDNYTAQVDVYASTAASARAVALALRNAYEPVAHIQNWRGESKDPETNNYRFSFDVDFIVNR